MSGRPELDETFTSGDLDRDVWVPHYLPRWTSLRIDVGTGHAYGVGWQPGSVVFRVDGEVVRALQQAADYPGS